MIPQSKMRNYRLKRVLRSLDWTVPYKKENKHIRIVQVECVAMAKY